MLPSANMNASYHHEWREALGAATQLMNAGLPAYIYEQGTGLYYVTTFKGSDKYVWYSENRLKLNRS